MLSPNSKSPELIIIAGPNGSGKSTLSENFLKDYNIKAFDWDAIFLATWRSFSFDPAVIQGISNSTNEKFQNHLDAAFKGKKDVAFETNFNTEIIMNIVDKAEKQGFKPVLAFMFVDKVETCIERVKSRAELGGHFVSEATIRERFKEGLEVLNKHYNRFSEVYLIDASKEWKSRPITADKERVPEIIKAVKENTLSQVKSDLDQNKKKDKGLSF